MYILKLNKIMKENKKISNSNISEFEIQFEKTLGVNQRSIWGVNS
jgi:hypothetical protein